MSNLAKKTALNEDHDFLISAGELFNPSILDDVEGLKKYVPQKISVVIPTFNRSPFPVGKNSNPLGWCLESLLLQRNSGLDEIIVVNDNSNDYTGEVVEEFSSRSPICVTYIRNSSNIGSSISRNKAVKKSKNELIMFLDDDCVFSRHMLFGANWSLNKLGEPAAVMHLPVYQRKTVPSKGSLKDIGVFNLEEGNIQGNFDKFPIEYLENLESNLMDNSLRILNPIEVSHVAGVFLVKKEAFQKVGGFPDFFTWRNGYREEADLSLRLRKMGYKLFHTVDPKFYCVHLRYGDMGEIEDTHPHENLSLLTGMDLDLRSLIEQSNVKRNNTGNRVDVPDWFYSRILSTYVVMSRHNPEAGRVYLYDTYREFVVENKLAVTATDIKIKDYHERLDIFDRARMEGERLLSLSD